MKAYFNRLFDYDHSSNQAMLNAILMAGSPQKPVQLMAHLLAAQQVWLGRCKDDVAAGELWPDWPADLLLEINEANYKAWTDFLKNLNENDFERVVNYKNSKGTAYQNKLVDVLAHLINHGTHHWAQAGQQLKFTGVEKLPGTDYIFYIRDN